MNDFKALYRIEYKLRFADDLYGETLVFLGDYTGFPLDFGQKSGELLTLREMVIELLDQYLKGQDRIITSLMVKDQSGSLIINE